MIGGSASPQFSMSKVMSKSSCVIFSKMFFNLTDELSGETVLHTQLNMMSMLISKMMFASGIVVHGP